MPNILSSLTLLCPEGIFCRLMRPNRPLVLLTSTDPLLRRERETLHLNLSRLMENAGPWKGAFSGYMNTLEVDQPYANWHGCGWIADVDCNSGPCTKSPLQAPTPPPELNRRSSCCWHKARYPHQHEHKHTILVSPPVTNSYVLDTMMKVQELRQKKPPKPKATTYTHIRIARIVFFCVKLLIFARL